jgi:hypothetical protein
MKIKIDKVDTLFSKCIRERDDHTCQWCGRQDGTLQCSHIYGRRHRGTRWHPDNAKTLCFTCHRKWHESPVDAFKWVEGYLGIGLLDLVREQAYAVRKLTKADKEEIYQFYKQEYERLLRERENGKIGKLKLGNPM